MFALDPAKHCNLDQSIESVMHRLLQTLPLNKRQKYRASTIGLEEVNIGHRVR